MKHIVNLNAVNTEAQCTAKILRKLFFDMLVNINTFNPFFAQL